MYNITPSVFCARKTFKLMLLKLIKKEGFDTQGGGDEGDKGGLGCHSTQQKRKKKKKKVHS